MLGCADWQGLQKQTGHGVFQETSVTRGRGFRHRPTDTTLLAASDHRSTSVEAADRDGARTVDRSAETAAGRTPSATQHGRITGHGVKLDKRRACSRRISFRSVHSGRIERASIRRSAKKGNSLPIPKQVVVVRPGRLAESAGQSSRPGHPCTGRCGQGTWARPRRSVQPHLQPAARS